MTEHDRDVPGGVPQIDTERLDSLRDLDPGSGTAYLDRAIDNFCVSSRDAVEKIHAGLDADDADTVAAVAHKIAGSALNLGLPEAGEAARELDVLATAGELDRVAALLPDVAASFERGRALLVEYQAGYR